VGRQPWGTKKNIFLSANGKTDSTCKDPRHTGAGTLAHAPKVGQSPTCDTVCWPCGYETEENSCGGRESVYALGWSDGSTGRATPPPPPSRSFRTPFGPCPVTRRVTFRKHHREDLRLRMQGSCVETPQVHASAADRLVWGKTGWVGPPTPSEGVGGPRSPLLIPISKNYKSQNRKPQPSK